MDPELFTQILSSVVFALATGVVFYYAPGAIIGAAERRPTHAHYLIMGIVMAFTGTAILLGYSIWWRAVGSPDDVIQQSLFPPLGRFFIISGATLHLTTKEAAGGMPIRQWIVWSLLITMSIIFGLGLTVWLAPVPNMEP